MILPALKINSERFKSDFDALAEIGGTVAGGVSRLALSNEDLEARSWFADKLEECGLRFNDDEAGNLSGILPSDNPHAKTLLIGSHLDTVPHGGRYDGALGVLAGLECIRTIKESGLKLPLHLEVIDFTDEEGCWSSLFGSRGLAGFLVPEDTNDAKQDNGPFRAALYRAGIRPADVFRAKRDPNTLFGYMELHIEQGYHLDRDGIDIGVVKGIVGRVTYDLTFHGEASHSGTTAVERRRDAFQGAAAYTLWAHQMIRDDFPGGVFNCGNAKVYPGKFNIIPSEATMTIECRHPEKDVLARMEKALLDLAEQVARDYRLTISWEIVGRMPATQMDARFMEAIERTCDVLQVSHQRLASYAGHDAQTLSRITPSAMIFIPSVDGISHSPKEYSHWVAIEKGANVLLHTILDLAESAE